MVLTISDVLERLTNPLTVEALGVEIYGKRPSVSRIDELKATLENLISSGYVGMVHDQYVLTGKGLQFIQGKVKQ